MFNLTPSTFICFVAQSKSLPKICKKINIDDIPLQEPDHESGITFNLFKGGYQVTDYLNIDS